MRILSYIFLVFISLFFGSCATRKIKDIAYMTPSGNGNRDLPKLNIFKPRKPLGKMPVLIFIHGGNWNTGSKDTYGFFGRNFAGKGVITIIPDYTLSPEASYDEMARQVAAVVEWARENISQYDGDPDDIYLTGHSAGGHLAALAVMNPKYGVEPTSISGIILNDAAGLDMKNYLEDNPPSAENDYLATWTNDPEKWQDASPIYYINEQTPPLMIYVGDKTYESISIANQRFLKALKAFQPDTSIIHVNKKHVPMIVQYFWPWNKRIDETIHFMNQHKISPQDNVKNRH